MSIHSIGLAIGGFFLAVAGFFGVSSQSSDPLIGYTTSQVFQGGTGFTSARQGELITGSADHTQTLSKLATGSTGQVLKMAGGLPAWGSDLTGGGGGTQIEVGVGQGDGGTLTSSVSFSPSGFNVTDKSGWLLVDLDYTNGPASRSIAQTITGQWGFSFNPTFATGYSLPLTASQTAWEVLKDGGPYLTGNQTITLTGGVTGSGTTSIATTVASESYWDLAYAYKNIGHLPLAGGTLTGNLIGTGASFSTGFDMTGGTSSSFGGSLNITKSATVTKSVTAESFQMSGTASSTWAGSLNLSKGVHATGNVTTSGMFIGNLTGAVTGNASTATALAANPTDCSANQFANAIVANGNLTCASIADGDVPDTITVSNYLLLTGGSISGGFDVAGTGSTSFAGSLDISKGIRAVAATFSGILKSTLRFIFPTRTASNVNVAGAAAVNTASDSLNFYGTAERVINPKRCVAKSLMFSDLTNKNQFTIFVAEDAMTIDAVYVTASGSGSLTWNLLAGSATVPATAVWTAGHSASGSAITKYTSFTSATVGDRTKLDLVVSSTSATLDSVYVRACMLQNP